MTASSRFERSAAWARAALLLGAVAAVLVHCAAFRDFVVDDAAISFSYARNLAEGHGLVLTPGGERVEGYSNFLWVLLLAAGVRLGLGAFLAAKVLGMAFAAATVVGAAELLAALRGRRSPLDAVPAALTAALTPVPYWSMSGLEGSLFLALVVWTATRLVRERGEPDRRPLSAPLAAMLALTRPDGVLFLGAASVLRLLGDRSWRRLAAWYALALGPVAVHVAWRLAYYAYPLPNTYYAKAAEQFQPRDLWNLKSSGWRYVLGVVKRYELWPLLAAAALALARWRGLRARLTPLAFVACVVFFPIYAHGDWMSEGRFVVAALPLVAALAMDGGERVAGIVSPGRLARQLAPAVSVALALVLAWLTVPRALAVTKERRGHYPVPVTHVAIRAHEYARMAAALELSHPSALDADLGGTSYYAGMPIVDLASLTDVTVAHWRWHPAVLREYVWGERRPTITRIGGNWTDTVLHRVAEFTDQYVPLSVNRAVMGDLQMARAAFLVDGLDPRRPLAQFDAAGVDLIGAEVAADEIRLWLLVRCEGRGRQLEARADGREVAVVPAAGLYPRAAWRAGEIVTARVALASQGPVQVCDGDQCVALAPGVAGSVPVTPPAPSREACERAAARADLTVAAACVLRTGRTDAALGRSLHERARAAEAAADYGRAFADYQLAVAVDPSRAFSRRRLEALRLAPRDTYRYAASARLDRALREHHLDPTPRSMSRVATAALVARRPEIAVRAHLATGLLPDDDRGRLDLAAAYLQVGLPEAGAALLPPPPEDPAAAARAEEIALAAGDTGAARAAAGALRRTAVAVAPGLRLVHAWARLRRSGEVELALALERDGHAAPDALTIAGRRSPFVRPPRSWAAGEVYVHRAPVAGAAGRARVAVGSATLELDVEPFTHDFENGTLDGWSATGNAFSLCPRAHTRKRATFGFQGNRYLDTFAGDDRARGALRSPVLRPGIDEVCFVVGGGAAPGTGVALEVDGTVTARAGGRRDEVLRDACLDARPFAGRRIRVLVLDDDSRPWGHVLADDFECLRGGVPVPCAGRVEVTPPGAPSARLR